MFGPQKHPLRVDGHDVIPLGFAGLLETLPDHNTSVVHQDIELAIASDRCAHRLDPIGVAGHIQMQVRRFAACGAYLGLDLFPRFLPDVTQHHLRAFACKQFRLCSALAPGSAADQGHLPIEPSHVSLLVLVVPPPALLASQWSSSTMARSGKSHQQSPHTIVCHHPWVPARRARRYPTPKRGRRGGHTSSLQLGRAPRSYTHVVCPPHASTVPSLRVSVRIAYILALLLLTGGAV